MNRSVTCPICNGVNEKTSIASFLRCAHCNGLFENSKGSLLETGRNLLYIQSTEGPLFVENIGLRKFGTREICDESFSFTVSADKAARLSEDILLKFLNIDTELFRNILPIKKSNLDVQMGKYEMQINSNDGFGEKRFKGYSGISFGSKHGGQRVHAILISENDKEVLDMLGFRFFMREVACP